MPLICSEQSKLSSHPKWFKSWIFLFTLASLMLVILVFNDFGITWDEQVQSKYGELVLDYYQSGFTNYSCNQFLNLRFYGPFFELICAVIYDHSREIKYEIRHLCMGTTTVITILGLIKFCQLFQNRLIPFFASLSLVCFPRFVGHGFNNSKDMPFACFFVWAIYALAKAHISLHPRLHREWFFCGVAIGLALSVRIGGVILLGYHILCLAFVYFIHLLKQRKFSFLPKNGSWFTSTLYIFAVSWIVMVLFWPWAHENMLLHPLQALKESTNFRFSHLVQFEGEILKSSQLPRYYLIKYLLITTPLILLILAIIGIILSFRIQAKSKHGSELTICFLAQLWLFFPMGYFILRTPNIYDGLRHFLFILPAVSVFAGIGGAGVYQQCRSFLPGKLSFCLVLSVFLLPLKDIVSLHPYQMTYYNGLAGGLKEAQKSYETDYWASSYKEAAEWINEQVRKNHDRKVTVLLAANKNSRICAEYYLEKNIDTQTLFSTEIQGAIPADFDYYLATTRYKLSDNFPDSPVVHTIGRHGAVFTVIKGHK